MDAPAAGAGIVVVVRLVDCSPRRLTCGEHKVPARPTSTPFAAAWRPHSLIGGECGRKAASHGYTAPVLEHLNVKGDPIVQLLTTTTVEQ